MQRKAWKGKKKKRKNRCRTTMEEVKGIVKENERKTEVNCKTKSIKQRGKSTVKTEID